MLNLNAVAGGWHHERYRFVSSRARSTARLRFFVLRELSLGSLDLRVGSSHMPCRALKSCNLIPYCVERRAGRPKKLHRVQPHVCRAGHRKTATDVAEAEVLRRALKRNYDSVTTTKEPCRALKSCNCVDSCTFGSGRVYDFVPGNELCRAMKNCDRAMAEARVS